MSKNKDTVTDFAPICPYCGEHVEIDDGRIAIALILQQGLLKLHCHECDNSFAIECNLIWTTKKVKEK